MCSSDLWSKATSVIPALDDDSLFYKLTVSSSLNAFTLIVRLDNCKAPLAALRDTMPCHEESLDYAVDSSLDITYIGSELNKQLYLQGVVSKAIDAMTISSPMHASTFEHLAFSYLLPPLIGLDLKESQIICEIVNSVHLRHQICRLAQEENTIRREVAYYAF